MEREKGFPEDMRLSAFIRSDHKGYFIIGKVGRLIRWGIPSVVDAGASLDNKLAQASNKVLEAA
ncbi:MAG: hypothetical protein A2776_02670 [Candidatus Levybacteria bacterium RIFCSPHIGHO2_01_FULL_40_10]|nr:MAG: hypothetical protein A2776_02670 [Candidatus Levybacteria bacterium RIFCSPHIGHO2_01_FULL_40_10]